MTVPVLVPARPTPDPKTHKLLYLIGVPGAGKTTLMRALMETHGMGVLSKPYTHTVLRGGIALGTYTTEFGGVDRYALGALPGVVAWLLGLNLNAATHSTDCRMVVGEGARLAEPNFFNGVQRGYTLEVYWLHVPERIAELRRSYRSKAINAQWVHRCTTQTLRLGAEYVPQERVLDGTRPVDWLIKRLFEFESWRQLVGMDE